MINNLFISFLAIVFNPMNFVHNLYYMGMGMLCIMIVMGVLILITTALNKLAIKFSKKKNDEDKK